ncbi:MAG TPA: FAD-binding and (Fe-S)-binding domain-containing protein [Solirubrobacteraceae bacterium]|nr:FAD-binding and (Fe-S)-binding domain-containing protein [Solirubrobacteraceae bacterium]
MVRLSAITRLLRPDPARIAPERPQPSGDRAPEWVAAGTPESLRADVIAALGADRVLTRAIDLVKYASDASPYRLIPKAIAMPHDIDDVVGLMAFARRTGTPLVFRAGGTSLNGQSQTDSVLVDVRRHWQRAQVLDGGAQVRAQPGIVLGHVNRLLARHDRKLGPDPASIDIACVGGVVANNSGGMRCGVVADSYRTVRSMTLVLPSGAVIDTAAPDAEARFAAAAPGLATGLIEIRDELRADAELAERVRRKFEIKNTTGYRLCAFLDADTPLEIFRRLVIGSEGTLAFLAEAVFDTVPLGRHTTIALVFFEDVDAAAEAVAPLVAAGATATELMVAPTLIAAAWNMPGTPERWKELPLTSAALLVEFRAEEPDALDAPERAALEILQARTTIDPPAFTRDAEEIEMVWRVREGMQGLLAAVRPPGVQLIIEDVCVPPARVAEAAKDLQALLSKHGFLPGLAGHASAGNLHFLLTPNFGEPADLDRYDAFVHELTEMIVGTYDGSLKAEHGTGLNMAPFVEREWGRKATEMMWRIKQLADPDGILAPGVVLNRDPGVHLRNLKSIPEIEEVATKCIECGFCEPVCPSRNVTTTPRQRIAVRREMARQLPGSPVLETLLEQYQHEGIDTCAVDGSCMRACPVAIDTGALVKGLRRAEHGEQAERAAAAVARRYELAERFARGSLRVGRPAARAWRRNIPPAAPAQLPFTVREGAAAVYMPACINRIFGNGSERDEHPTVPDALVAISRRAGLPVWIPDDVGGHCCGTPWSSKGFARGHELMAQRIAAALARWSDAGALPVVVDASSCSHGLIAEVAPAGVEILDSIAWVHDRLLERLQIRRKLGRVVVHPTCSATHLGLARKLEAIASAITDDVVVPASSGCCGMAGDRGWLHPELPRSALRDLAHELEGQTYDACLTSNRTCEVALREVTGRPYTSFVLALEELTR